VLQQYIVIIKNAAMSKSQNMKDRSRANNYLIKIKVNLRTKVGICISTYSNADVVMQGRISGVTSHPPGAAAYFMLLLGYACDELFQCRYFDAPARSGSQSHPL